MNSAYLQNLSASQGQPIEWKPEFPIDNWLIPQNFLQINSAYPQNLSASQLNVVCRSGSPP